MAVEEDDWDQRVLDTLKLLPQPSTPVSAPNIARKLSEDAEWSDDRAYLDIVVYKVEKTLHRLEDMGLVKGVRGYDRYHPDHRIRSTASNWVRTSVLDAIAIGTSRAASDDA